MPTVAACKATFQAQIAPGDNASFLRILQEVDTRLLEANRHGWTKARVTLTPASGYVTLPAEYASILGVQVDDFAADIRAVEHEFMPYGEGDIPVGVGGTRLIDQGLNDVGERTYKVAGHLNDGETIDCLVLKAPVVLYDPDMNESDVPAEAVTETLCPDMGALKLGCLAVVYEEAGDPGNARAYFSDAYRRLDAREKSRRGEARQSAVFKPVGPGIRRIQNFR